MVTLDFMELVGLDGAMELDRRMALLALAEGISASHEMLGVLLEKDCVIDSGNIPSEPFTELEFNGSTRPCTRIVC